MDLSHLPKEIEDLILTYRNQMEHTERFEPVLLQIERMRYHTYDNDNCMNFTIENPGGRYRKTYHIKFCRTCHKYYRTNIIEYADEYSRCFRFSYYNSYMNREEEILTSDYIINYVGNNLRWTNRHRHRRFNKNVSCHCLENIWNPTDNFAHITHN